MYLGSNSESLSPEGCTAVVSDNIYPPHPASAVIIAAVIRNITIFLTEAIFSYLFRSFYYKSGRTFLEGIVFIVVYVISRHSIRESHKVVRK